MKSLTNINLYFRRPKQQKGTEKWERHVITHIFYHCHGAARDRFLPDGFMNNQNRLQSFNDTQQCHPCNANSRSTSQIFRPLWHQEVYTRCRLSSVSSPQPRHISIRSILILSLINVQFFQVSYLHVFRPKFCPPRATCVPATPLFLLKKIDYGITI
jgi:hypothetical protein